MAAPQAAGFGAGAGLTQVVQEGPDRYRATFANGNSIPLIGQAGKNLFEKQQAAIALSQPRAQPTSPEQVAPAPAPTQPGERVGSTVVSAPQPGQAEPEAPAAPAPEQQQAGPQSLGYTMKSVDPATGKETEGEAFRMPDGSIGVFKAPTRGSPGGLTPLGKQTMEQYAEAQTMAAQHSAKASEFQQVGVDLAVKDAQAQQAYLEERRVQAMLEARDAAEEEAAIQQKVAGLEASYEKARQDFANARVDPDRYVKSKPGGNWLLGLSAALGAFGATLGRTSNFAMDFINARIADDVRSQEAEINVKGRDADNQLAQLTRSMGDLSLAKKAYRQLKLEEATIEGQRVAGQFKGQQIANTAAMVAEQAAAEGIRAGQEKSQAFVEKVMKDKLYFRQGSAGSPGGFMKPQLGGVQNVKDLHKEEAGEAGSAKSLSNERTAQMAGDASIIALGKDILANPVAQGDSDIFEAEGSIRSKVPLVGPALAPSEFKKYEQDLQKWQNLRIKAITGAGLSEQEAVRIAKGEVGENKAVNRVRQGVNAGMDEAVVRLRTNFAALTPEQQQQMLNTLPPAARDAVLGKR